MAHPVRRYPRPYLAVLLLSVTSAACSGHSEPPEVPPVTFTAFGDDGSTTTITTSPEVIIAQVATWCSYSRQYVDFTKDKEVQDHLGGKRLIFLFERDEWPDVRRLIAKQLKRPGVWVRESEIDQRIDTMKERAGFSPLYDPEVLADLPGQYYFLPRDSPIRGNAGYPSIYNPVTGKCTSDAVKAFVDVIPAWVVYRAWDRHSVDGEQ